MIARKYNIYSTGPQGDVVCNGSKFYAGTLTTKEVKKLAASSLGVPVEALMVEPTNEIKTLE